MGWNDRMDFPEAYGAQYARDRVYGSVSTVHQQRADAEPECTHESSVPDGDGFEKCIDCGETFVPAAGKARVA